jgi:opacity protein-like surface antigen
MRMNLLLFVLLGVSATVSAQSRYGRAGTWEAGFTVFDASSQNWSGGESSSINVDGDWGFGFIGGYNFTDHLAVLGEVAWYSPDYDATIEIDGSGELQTLRGSLDVSTFQVKGVYYLLEGDLSPFIEAGAGWTRIDTNIIDGPPTTGCWWMWPWGYVCSNFYSTYADTRVSYAAAVGVRWDLTPDMLAKASWGVLEVDTSGDAEDANLDIIRLDFLWKF